jgi:hypothetical protein
VLLLVQVSPDQTDKDLGRRLALVGDLALERSPQILGWSERDLLEPVAVPTPRHRPNARGWWISTILERVSV